MVINFRRIPIAWLALVIALPIMANAQDINLATGGAELIWKGTKVNAKAGAWMDLGDLSGDGRRDLVVGSPGTDGVTGAVFVIYGGPERTGERNLSTADVVITSADAGSLFGASTATGNVLNADGSNPKNLAIGAPGFDGGRGKVYLYAAGWGVGTALTTANAAFTFTGAAGDQLGAALATGDLDKDGFRELIIGAPGNNRVYILTYKSGSLQLAATLQAAGLGNTLIAGDITGDGIYDLLVGAPTQNVVYAYVGTNGTIPSVPVTSFSGVTSGDEAGASVRLLDLDADGANDVVIGAPGGDGPGGGRTNAGNVYVFFGPISNGPRSLADAHAVIYGAAANFRAGERIATGDINRDTPNDLVILSPGGSSGAGELDLYYGRSRGSIGSLSGSTRVVDFAVPGHISRRIFGDPSAGAIAAAQVYEVTGEGARDVIVGVPGADASAGRIYFTISPRMRVSRLSETLTANEGDSATSATAIDVTNPSVVVTGWQATTDAPWLSASPASGSISESAPGAFYIVASAASLPPGVYSGIVTVRANSPDLVMSLPIAVTFTVTGARLSIDTPATGATVSNGFAIAGWAADVAATSGTGVSSVEAYAFPAGGGSPIYLGAASYGFARPDVGSLYGSQFTNSGYSLTVNNLTPGASYNLGVFAKSSVTGRFAEGKAVSVTVASSSAPAGPTPTDPNPTPPSDPSVPTGPGPGPTGPTADTRIALNRAGLYFAGTNNGALLSGTQTASVTFTNGSGSWSISTTANWLSISPAAGTGSATFSVSVIPGSYLNGSVRTATITVTAPGVPNSPISIPVQLTIITAPSAPGGLFETPTDNITGVTGSIAVTGWVLDDIGVTEVSIWRDPVAGESVSSSNGKVFIGNAVRIDGARPDVDAIAAVPFDYMAGWGYLLLTNMLPNQGNGTFVLHAYAADVDGHLALLGSKTITGDNANATKPFGAIDTPQQGETISGSSYVNFGWALGAQNNVIPTNGSTITVFIDGVPVGHPQYNFARSDIQTLFPGHANTDGAVGFYVIDTTRLSNGVHTIAWGVTDAAGHSEGIGSRFFTVLNASSSSVMTTPALMQGSNGTEEVTRTEAAEGSETGKPVAAVAAIVASDVPSYAQRGFAMNAPLEILDANAVGAPTLTIEEVGVVRATVGAPVDDEGSYEGYFIKGGRLESLPAGAFLDGKTGEFFWQPGVGFVGTYEFVFIRKANGTRERIPLSVVIEPRDRAKGTLLPSRSIR